MKKPLTVLLTSAGLILSGCAATTGTASRTTTTAPAGPITTSTSEPGVIPAGTQLAVRTNEAISSEQAEPGKTYSAEITNDVIDQTGKVLIPRGARAELAVVETSSGGAVGSAELGLALRSITIGGRSHSVATETEGQEADRAGLGTNRRTAEMVGGGALLGAAIGAIAGGGSGAAAGAAVGAAGGAAAQVLTRGKEVRIPAETVLTFRLDQPIRLQG